MSRANSCRHVAWAGAFSSTDVSYMNLRTKLLPCKGVWETSGALNLMSNLSLWRSMFPYYQPFQADCSFPKKCLPPWSLRYLLTPSEARSSCEHSLTYVWIIVAVLRSYKMRTWSFIPATLLLCQLLCDVEDTSQAHIGQQCVFHLLPWISPHVLRSSICHSALITLFKCWFTVTFWRPVQPERDSHRYIWESASTAKCRGKHWETLNADLRWRNVLHRILRSM